MAKKPTAEDRLIWAAYVRAPENRRLYKRLEDMSLFARQTWLSIARKHLAAGGTLNAPIDAVTERRAMRLTRATTGQTYGRAVTAHGGIVEGL